MLHPWEEPCLGERAGAIFFCGCPLGCVYCQNQNISRPREGGLPGEVYDIPALSATVLDLQRRGATCIDLITPTHYAPEILEAIRAVRERLSVPVVWNTGGYERVEIISACASLVDIFLTDFKYGTSALAASLSDAPDYPAVAAAALREMHRVAGAPRFAGDRMMGGVILRHLILPGGRRDSEAALRLAADSVPPGEVILSLMSQYTPDFAPPEMPAMRRRITTFEYESVRETALRLGFEGYGQERGSASRVYTPV